MPAHCAQIGLVGVFPYVPVSMLQYLVLNNFPNSYSAIDMSTFEALKLAYQRSTGKDEPGVMALLAFGSISGSVGATSVYPLNFVRTRLQASGSSGHPQCYTGVWDVTLKTWESGGWKGFYRGLFPTLAKVSPAWFDGSPETYDCRLFLRFLYRMLCMNTPNESRLSTCHTLLVIHDL